MTHEVPAPHPPYSRNTILTMPKQRATAAPPAETMATPPPAATETTTAPPPRATKTTATTDTETANANDDIAAQKILLPHIIDLPSVTTMAVLQVETTPVAANTPPAVEMHTVEESTVQVAAVRVTKATLPLEIASPAPTAAATPHPATNPESQEMQVDTAQEQEDTIVNVNAAPHQNVIIVVQHQT